MLSDQDEKRFANSREIGERTLKSSMCWPRTGYSREFHPEDTADGDIARAGDRVGGERSGILIGL